MYAYGLQKDSTDEPMYTAAMEMQTQRTERATGNLLFDSGSTTQFYDNLERWNGVGVWEGDSGQGIYVYQWLIHADVWQKPTPYCKSIILQFKKKKRKQITNKHLQYGTGNATQYSVITYIGIKSKMSGSKYMYNGFTLLYSRNITL